MLGTLMRGWAEIVESAALLAIVVLAFGVMVRVVKLGHAMKYLGAIVGVVILLVMLPEIIIVLWQSMTAWQQLGIAFMGIAACIILYERSGKRKTRSR